MTSLNPTDSYQLVPAFYFSVRIDEEDIPFHSVSGLSATIKYKETMGVSLPEGTEYGDLVLSRALTTINSKFAKWIFDIFYRGFDTPQKFVPKTAVLQLLDAESNPVFSWRFIDLLPKKWELSSLDAQKNELVIETITFEYASVLKIV
jgi:phage tail-like protein